MTRADPDVPAVGAGREHRGRGFLLVAVVSTALGIVGIIPFVMVGYAVEQLLLAPLGWASVDPTNDDGTAALVVLGVGAPLAVAGSWTAVTAAVVRRCRLGRWGWAVSGAGLAAPTLAFAASKLG